MYIYRHSLRDFPRHCGTVFVEEALWKTKHYLLSCTLLCLAVVVALAHLLTRWPLQIRSVKACISALNQTMLIKMTTCNYVVLALESYKSHSTESCSTLHSSLIVVMSVRRLNRLSLKQDLCRKVCSMSQPAALQSERNAQGVQLV